MKILLIALLLPGVLLAKFHTLPQMEFQNNSSLNINVSRVLYMNATKLYIDDPAERKVTRPVGISFSPDAIYGYEHRGSEDRRYFYKVGQNPNTTIFKKRRSKFYSFGYVVSRAPRFYDLSFDRSSKWDKTTLVLAEYLYPGLSFVWHDTSGSIGEAAVIELSKKEWKKITNSKNKKVKFEKKVKFYAHKFIVDVKWKKENMEMEVAELNNTASSEADLKRLIKLERELEYLTKTGGEYMASNEGLYKLRESTNDPEFKELVGKSIIVTCKKDESKGIVCGLEEK